MDQSRLGQFQVLPSVRWKEVPPWRTLPSRSCCCKWRATTCSSTTYVCSAATAVRSLMARRLTSHVFACHRCATYNKHTSALFVLVFFYNGGFFNAVAGSSWNRSTFPSKIKILDERRRCFKGTSPSKIKILDERRRCFKGTSPSKIKILDERRRCFKGTSPSKIKILDERRRCFKGTSPSKIKILDERRRCFKGTSPSKIKILDERRRCFKGTSPSKIKILDERRRCFKGTSPSKIKILDERRRCFKGTICLPDPTLAHQAFRHVVHFGSTALSAATTGPGKARHLASRSYERRSC